ncbi:MAG TPA: tetratricopeptide repeat protein, partial [Nitrosopumilaceae archaeon]|nr:tetratricopeptide repeat protein [Nitrosopumilaceae archaeon]
KADETWQKAKKYYPNNPYLQTYNQYLAGAYMSQSIELGKKGKLDEAIKKMERASELCPGDPEVWYNIGGAAYTKKDYVKAKNAFEKCLQLNPNHEQAKNGYQSLPK